MRIGVDASAIRPDQAAGVERFTYGLLGGLAESQQDRLDVTVLAGTADLWKSRVESERVCWAEADMPLRSDNNIGQAARRVLPRSFVNSRFLRSSLNVLRHRSLQRHETADVVLYPSSSRPIAADPAVLVLHDLRAFTPEFRSPGMAATIRSNVAKAAAVVVTWPHPYQQAQETFPEAIHRMALIPTPAFQVATHHSGARQPGLLVYPSSTAPHKNHETLLEAMTLLPEYNLVCPGPLVEPQASRLLARASQPDLAGRVDFPGFVSSEDLARLYSRADAVVIPSLWEAASGAMLEAFSWGLPVVCADVPPLRSQLRFGKVRAGVFSAKDPKSLANEVRSVLGDREMYARSSAEAGERLASRTWGATGSDYLAVLAWAAGDRSSPIPRSDFASRLMD